MTIEEAVYAVLSDDAGVTAICPAARIKPDGVYQNLALPYIKQFPVALSVANTHSGMADLKEWPYQISMFAASAASMASLRSAVMAALEASRDPKFFVTGLVQLGDDSPSTDKPILGQALLVSAWYE
jgi:hypothetical protein